MARGRRTDLFSAVRPDPYLHPAFRLLASAPKYASTRRLMNDAFACLPDRDENFVEQFQTTGFDARTFELYVSELLRDEGFASVGHAPHPDFISEKAGVRVAIECTTANPTREGNGGIVPYEAINKADADPASIEARARDEVPIRIGGALRNKMRHRVKDDRPKAYWELDAVRGAPFVLAVQDFHEHGALGFTSSSVARYLYGIGQSGSLDAAGRLVIEETRVDRHRWGKKDIPSGFFDLEGSEHVSAVLWTNAGTAPKFTRMALAGLYPDANVTMVRFGSMFDPDPDAFAPVPFVYLVGDPDAPDETWGQEAVLFHNPRALHPVPVGLFESIAEGSREDDGYADLLKGPFVPYSSTSATFHGPGHRRAAMTVGEAQYAGLLRLHEAQLAAGPR